MSYLSWGVLGTSSVSAGVALAGCSKTDCSLSAARWEIISLSQPTLTPILQVTWWPVGHDMMIPLHDDLPFILQSKCQFLLFVGVNMNLCTIEWILWHSLCSVKNNMFWFLCVRLFLGLLESALAAWQNHCHEKIPQTFYVMRYHNLPGTTIKWIRMAVHLTPSTGVQVLWYTLSLLSMEVHSWLRAAAQVSKSIYRMSDILLMWT